MKHGLDIRQDAALDFVSLGALIHRLDPGLIPFRKATECQIHVSGGEFNCAANLADVFRLETGIVSAMVDYPIGDLIAERVRAMGVKPFYKQFKHNGVNGPNMGTVYSDRGHGVRAPVVFYNRANEAAAQLKPGDFDWAAIFRGGVRWFHSGGIFASLSDTTGELIIEGMKAAHAAGAVTSFDLNYRAKLWNIWGGGAKAQSVIQRIVENVDVLVGNEEDLQLGLGIPGPEVAAAHKLDPSAFFGMIDEVVGAIRRSRSSRRRCARCTRRTITVGARSRGSMARRTSRRRASSTSSIAWAAAMASRPGSSTACSRAPEAQEAVNLGWAHGALLTTFPGDTSMATWRTCGRSRRAGRRASSGDGARENRFVVPNEVRDLLLLFRGAKSRSLAALGTTIVG